MTTSNAVALVGPEEDGIRSLPDRSGMAPVTRPAPMLPSPDELKALQTYGEMIAASKLFPKVQSWQAAVVIMQFGQQLGIDAFTALKDIDWIEGKPAVNAGLINTLIKRDHGGEAILPVESSKTLVKVKFKRREWAQYEEASLSLDDIPAGLKLKDNWKNYPEDMLWARLVSRLGRRHFADTIKGVYTPEELQEARVVETTARIVERPRPAPIGAASEPVVTDVVAETTGVEIDEPTADPPADLCTDEQAKAIRAQGLRKKLSTEDLETLLGGERWADVLTREEAGQWIGYLQKATNEHLRDEINKAVAEEAERTKAQASAAS